MPSGRQLELAVDHTQPIHYDEASSSTGKPVAMETKRTTYTVLIFVINLADQTTKLEGYTLRSRVEDDTVSKLNGESCYPGFIAKKPRFQRWTMEVWMNHMERGSNKKRFQCCWGSDGNILYTTKAQGILLRIK